MTCVSVCAARKPNLEDCFAHLTDGGNGPAGVLTDDEAACWTSCTPRAAAGYVEGAQHHRVLLLATPRSETVVQRHKGRVHDQRRAASAPAGASGAAWGCG